MMSKKGELADVLRSWVFYLILLVVLLIILWKTSGIFDKNLESIKNILRAGG